MYEARTVIQSVQNPDDRTLLLVNTKSGVTGTLQLPQVGPKAAWFCGEMYDCWGRHIPKSAEIAEVICQVGVMPARTVNNYVSVHLVKKANGRFALAAPTYYAGTTSAKEYMIEFMPHSHHLCSAGVTRAEFTCYGEEYDEVKCNFFDGTLMGSVLKELGHEMWLARIPGTEVYEIIVTNCDFLAHYVYPDSYPENGHYDAWDKFHYGDIKRCSGYLAEPRLMNECLVGQDAYRWADPDKGWLMGQVLYMSALELKAMNERGRGGDLDLIFRYFS